MTNQGFLAIWTRINPENFRDYRRWLSREHIGQRIFSPGFLGARVHAANSDEHTHFILYATEDKRVFQGAPYMEVLNNPTSWTQEMMPLLRDFDRAAGEQIIKVGDGTGAWLLVVKLFASADAELKGEQKKRLRPVLETDGVVTARLFALDRESTDIETTEKRMRDGVEGAFQALLVVEAMNEGALEIVESQIDLLAAGLYTSEVEIETSRYRFAYALHPFEAASVSTS